MGEILRAECLKKHFVKKSAFGPKTTVRAADGVSFSLEEGQVLVIAGESGSGKSTIARLILGSLEPDSGRVFFDGEETGRNPKRIRMNCQMVHQDPYDSINPRMRIRDIVAEPLEIHGIGDRAARERRVADVLGEVRLDAGVMPKYPHMLSGGQRQRVVLARALATRPRIIIADEPVSMLDVSIRAEMLELMQELQKRYRIAFVYITHDLATARHFGQRIAILYMGKIVETGSITDVLYSPRHPYTQALIDAVSEPDPANLHREKRIRILESAESPAPRECRFRPRCQYAVEACGTEPELGGAGGHRFACHVDIR